MKPEPHYIGQPIRSLQAMLREISFQVPDMPRLVADGVFGEETLEGVMVLQREAALPVTGVVDWPTWQAVVTQYRKARQALSPPRPSTGFPGRDFTIVPGDVCIHLHTLQAMLHALSLVLDQLESTPVTGQHTGASVRNILWLQRQAGLPQTGVLDATTWNHLVRLYDLFILRASDTALCSGREADDYPPPQSTWPVIAPTKGFPWEGQ